MKKCVIALVTMVIISAAAMAQTPRYKLTEATDLNLIGKILKDTPNPYHRVDTVKYKGFTQGENDQVRSSAGLAVLFKTNSTTISVYSEFGYQNKAANTMGVALRGYDLYIKKDGEWLYAATKEGQDHQNVIMINNMDSSMKECILYLPMYSEEYSVKVGVLEDAVIEPLESPFRHRVGIFGSSFTQGISISRTGMSYPMQFMRHTGIQMLSLGCSGNCKMQPYFADVLNDAEVDALVFDAFSNPDAKMIEERLFPFIEKLQTAHPDIPLIFMQTIHRGSRHFNLVTDRFEQDKMDMAEKMMKEACAKYKNVYFIQTCAHDKYHESSVDGIHPDDYGYWLWSKSIEKPLLKIFKKYGIR